MSMATEIRLLAATRVRGMRLDYEPQRLQRELEARSARWRMLL